MLFVGKDPDILLVGMSCLSHGAHTCMHAYICTRVRPPSPLPPLPLPLPRVQVFCMPYNKLTGKAQACSHDVYVERIKLMSAQVELAQDCGMEELTPP